MDTETLITHARSRFEHAAAKRALKEKYKAKLVFAYAGGLWNAGSELIATLMCCPDEESVLLDLYDNPVKVVTQELNVKTQLHWQQCMAEWLMEYTELNKNR